MTRSSRRYWNLTDILWHFVTFLHGRALGNGRVPPLHLRIFVEVDRLPLVARHPWPDCAIGDGVIISDEFAIAQPAVEHAIEPVRLLEKALLGVGGLAFVVFHEVVDLPEHRTGSSHLPHQPLEHAIAWLTSLRQELSGLVGEVDHERRRFHQAQARIAIDDGRDAIVWADLQEVGLELLVLADVDGMYGVGQAQLLEQDGSFAAIRGRPGIEVAHGFGSCARNLAGLALGNFAGPLSGQRVVARNRGSVDAKVLRRQGDGSGGTVIPFARYPSPRPRPGPRGRRVATTPSTAFPPRRARAPGSGRPARAPACR